MFCGTYFTLENENWSETNLVISWISRVSGIVLTLRTSVSLPRVERDDGLFVMEIPFPCNVGHPFLPLTPFRIRKNWKNRVTSCSMVWLKRWLQSSHSSRQISPLFPNDSEIAWAFCLKVAFGIERPQNLQTLFDFSYSPMLIRSSLLKTRTS